MGAKDKNWKRIYYRIRVVEEMLSVVDKLLDTVLDDGYGINDLQTLLDRSRLYLSDVREYIRKKYL